MFIKLYQTKTHNYTLIIQNKQWEYAEKTLKTEVSKT